MGGKLKSGFDIDLGNACSKDAYGWAKKTFVNRAGKAGSNASFVDGAFANILQFGNQRIGIASDGIGTKIELAERTKKYDSLGFDLVAMVADDLAANGLEPTNISNIIDVNLLDKAIINQLMEGLFNAAAFCGISVNGGEIAELGDRIGGWGDDMHFNWCSTAIGLLPGFLQRPIDGSAVSDGDLIIALKSRGFRSNGFSAIRNIMQLQFGDLWHSEPYDELVTWGEKLLTPSLIYAPAINALLAKKLVPNGIVHVTGGGIADNLSRVLKVTGLGARLTNLFEPLPVMKKIIDLGKVSLEKAYLYWNMGNGMLLVVKPEMVDSVLTSLHENNYLAQVAGKITQGKDILFN